MESRNCGGRNTDAPYKTIALHKEYGMYIPFPDTDIYCLTDSRQSLGRSAVDVVTLMLKAEIKIIQYREKDKDADEMLEECLAIR